MICRKSDRASVELVSSCLKRGGIAVLPTDTVYGLSGIVDLKDSVCFKTDQRMRTIKGRAETKPFIQLIASPQDIYAYTDVVLPPALLAKWPGALTVIVPVKADPPLAEAVPSVAFRCPGDAWLRQIVAACAAPIYSTSVNRSGSPVLDTMAAIRAEFGGEVDLLVDDGDKKGSLPSTIVSLLDGNLRVLRQGAVTV